ncbi:MAG: alkaline phosphatase family protein [Sphingobacteriaceae bacterium]|nr:alkaline phosphatase family protein [Sphingobacteriaceae bacterium]
MNKIIFLLIQIIAIAGFSQNKPANAESKPKLIVAIVVDQMRNDFIYRYWDRFGNGGFKKLVNNGFYFKNAHFNYIPTFTGPGHSSIFTGTTPKYHGIIANEWFEKQSGKMIYCVQDDQAKSIGTKSKNGKKSPRNQLSTTIGDEMKLSNTKSKVFAVSIKDRSAVLPAGHAADGAFWFDDASADFISSDFYMQQLPTWLNEFNEKKLTQNYLNGIWSTLYPIGSYTNSLADDNEYENPFPGSEKPVFPYPLKDFITEKKWGVIKSTPFGNSLTKDLALACLQNEGLGKDDYTDFFSVSFSCTDIIAHAFGPRSIEVEDTYLRLDKDLEQIIDYLDKNVGKDNYTLFLTADHGASDVPAHLINNKIPAGNINSDLIHKQILNFCHENYGDSTIIENVSNEQIFLKEVKLKELKINKDEIENKISNYIIGLNGIAEAYSSARLKNTEAVKNKMLALLSNGYNHKRSGNVAFTYQPGWMDHPSKGTTHGTGYNYDTHVPVLFYGKGIKNGNYTGYIDITQIAPTICELIKVNSPSATFSESLNQYLK